jgi:ACR3 family arsenite efflux pump ArsB
MLPMMAQLKWKKLVQLMTSLAQTISKLTKNRIVGEKSPTYF